MSISTFSTVLGSVEDNLELLLSMDPPSLLTPDTFTPLLRKLILTPDQFGAADSHLAFHHLLRPSSTTPGQVGSFLTALHLTGIDKQSDVLAAAAAVLHHHAVKLSVEGADKDFVVDIVGTGGDGWNTFNVSTTAAIVAAGAGARLLKVCMWISTGYFTDFRHMM